MGINPLQTNQIDASRLSLDQLASCHQLSDQAKVGEASRAFEAILLRQVLRESQQPVFKSKYASNSTADGIYRDLVSDQLAENISKSGSLGLGKSLARELQRQVRSTKPAESTSAIHAQAGSLPAAQSHDTAPPAHPARKRQLVAPKYE